MHGQRGDVTREDRVVDAFVELTGAVVGGQDVIGLLETLTERCAQFLAVDLVGLLLADGPDALHVMAASSLSARDLGTLQGQRREGPCHDCYLSGRQVGAADLVQQAQRWPHFVETALQAGFRSAHAVPVRLGARTLGVLGLFSEEAGGLGERDLAVAQALADVASIALIQDEHSDLELASQLQAALNGRVALEQAKGVLAQQAGTTVAQAFETLRRFARDRDLDLAEVAAAIVTRTLPAAEVLLHADVRT